MKLCMGCMEYYEDSLERCPHCGFGEDFEPDNALHLEPGSILLDRYVVGRVIGFGGFGVTYIGRDALLDTKVAIKEYLPSEFSTRMLGHGEVTVFGGDKSEQFEDGRRKFIEEAKKLAKFHSAPGIVKVYDSFEYNNTAYIVMELLEGETLSEKLKREKRIPEDRAIEMMIPVMKSLELVHKDGIIHRDIAPDNIFVTNSGNVKLIDFGAARYATTTHSRSLTVIIKPGFSPEEQYRSRGDQGAYTDVYALAATLYKMITGQTPPDALERRAFFENKRKDMLAPPGRFVKDIDENHETAILNALNVRIEDRTPDMQTFIAELKSTEPVKRRYGNIKRLDLLKIPLWAKASISTAAVIAAVFALLLATGVIRIESGLKDEIIIPDGHTRVPTVINNDYGTGEDRLIAAKLIMEIEGKETSDQIPENYILFQEVDGGSVVVENTVVGVTVSTPVIKQRVPDVAGLSKKDAEEQLRQLGFAVRCVEVYDNTISEGCVVSQSEEAYSEIPEGSELVLSISKGRDPAAEIAEKDIKLPSFVGLDYNEAIKKARELGLSLKISEKKYSKQYEKNAVIEQTPKEGITIKSTKPVELVVSLGFERVEVPGVKLMTEAQAKSQLAGRGLKAKIQYKSDETIAAGLVISQNPAQKTTVDVESEVVLVVSTGASTFSMPSVVGSDEASAYKTLTGKGLSVTVSYVQNDDMPEGEVLSQSVAANTKVKRGDPVAITVCTHSAVIEVPYVVGRSQQDAENAVTSAGFKVSVAYANSDSVAKGTVISQSPEAGSGLNEGSTVVINVSSGRAETAAAVSSAVKKDSDKPKNTSSVKTNTSSNTPSKNESKTLEPQTDTSSKKTSTVSHSEQQPTSVSISESIISMLVGESMGITATVSPENAKNKSLTWSSSDEGVVEVSDRGLLTAVGEGVASVTAETVNGKTATCRIIVSPIMPEELVVSPETLSMSVGESRGLSAQISPDNAADKEVTWVSSDPAVAEVSSKGLVSAISQGSAVITAETVNGITAECLIEVTDPGNVGTILFVPDGTEFKSAETVCFYIWDETTGLYADPENVGWVETNTWRSNKIIGTPTSIYAESYKIEIPDGHDVRLVICDRETGDQSESINLDTESFHKIFAYTGNKYYDEDIGNYICTVEAREE